MPLQAKVFEYDREKAVEYAYRWAYFRNPAYYDFSGLGGNCTNFASQCIYAGCGVMNYNPVYGWYYISANSKAPAWTGVPYLYNFLTGNLSVGPFGTDVMIYEAEPGDICQLRFYGDVFQHSPVIVKVEHPINEDNIFVAANSEDSNCRPVSSYSYSDIRFIHIEGYRKMV